MVNTLLYAEPNNVCAWAYPWNAPRPAIAGPERQLTRDEFFQGQAVLIRVKALPYELAEKFISRHKYLIKEKGIHVANKYLVFTLGRTILPRIDKVNAAHCMNVEASQLFISEADDYNRLAGIKNQELRELSKTIAGHLMEIYETRCTDLLMAYKHEPLILHNDLIQSELYGELARMARAFNIQPMHWARYLNGKLDARSAVACISRLVNADWWERQFKAQRMRWREALLIAIGSVSRDKSASSYASIQAIREVKARRLSNLEYLKSCDLENIETGERISLIEKVMASISNPEIRRMELMNTIAFTEQYAADNGDVGMFITITTPSKYHPTRTVGAEKRVQFNHNWDEAAYTPKDGQRYLVKVWASIRTAFKDNKLQVYGMRVVEPHHDATPHWHMMLFAKRAQRQQIIDIMRKYALKEDGHERGAVKNRFDCKHMNKGGAAGYIAKYIAKNIDGYALEGERDFETGELLSDAAAAVTAWAATWRIPQFHPIGLPAMGTYRECRRIRSLNLTETFDEEVEAVRAAADAGNFAAYITAQGGANTPRESQTVRVARRIADELNVYDEEVKKVVGIFAPHLGESNVFETRTTQWRIVSAAVDVDLLTLKSASGAPRSPVNNCGLGDVDSLKDRQPASLKGSIEASKPLVLQAIDWSDTTAVREIVARIKRDSPKKNRLQRSHDPYRFRKLAPSARLTKEEQARIPNIALALRCKGIIAERWELNALTRGAKITYGEEVIQYDILPDWPNFI